MTDNDFPSIPLLALLSVPPIPAMGEKLDGGLIGRAEPGGGDLMVWQSTKGSRMVVKETGI